MAAEGRIGRVEECDCQKSCRVNGSVHPDGATWQRGCDICACVVSCTLKYQCRGYLEGYLETAVCILFVFMPYFQSLKFSPTKNAALEDV